MSMLKRYHGYQYPLVTVERTENWAVASGRNCPNSDRRSSWFWNSLETCGRWAAGYMHTGCEDSENDEFCLFSFS